MADKKKYDDLASGEQAKGSSYKRDIALLTARINSAKADIKAKTILIQSLGNDIVGKQQHINDLEGHIAKGKQTLADILRKTNELDQVSMAKVLLSQDTISGFFKDVDSFQAVQEGLANVFGELRSDEASTSAEKEALTNRQNAAVDARYEIQQQQKKIESDQKDLNNLLKITEANQKAYSTQSAQRAAQAAKILAALFPLAGSKAIQFGDALNYANMVYQKTSVAPDFLLATLKQETGIGSNVGTCYMTNPSDGSGINTNTNTYVASVMKPSRDVQPFISITSSLGYDYKTTAVSCPQSIGYGGGMGPAQFIASTWMLFIDRLVADLGVSVPNPWKPLDSFMAAGLYMSDLGANSSTYSAQWNAACKYYSGSRCPTGQNYKDSTHNQKSGGLYYTKHELEIRGYANSVMSIADSIQSQINQVQ